METSQAVNLKGQKIEFALMVTNKFKKTGALAMATLADSIRRKALAALGLFSIHQP